MMDRKALKYAAKNTLLSLLFICVLVVIGGAAVAFVFLLKWLVGIAGALYISVLLGVPVYIFIEHYCDKKSGIDRGDFIFWRK